MGSCYQTGFAIVFCQESASFMRRTTRCRSHKLAAEIVERDVLGFDAEIVQHLEHRRVHHRWSADVVLDVFRGGVLTQIVLQQDLMNEALVPRPIVFWKWLGKSDIELEVRKFFLDRAEVIDVKQFPHTPSAVPVRHFTAGSKILEQLENVASKRRHASSTADVHHLSVAILDEEFTIRTRDGDFVPLFQVEDVTRHLAGREFRVAWRRSRDSDVEHDDALLAGVIRHGIGSHHIFVHLGYKTPDVEFVPVLMELLVNHEVFVVHDVRRAFDLDVSSGLEINVFAFRQLENQLLDESGDIVVGSNGTFPLLRFENFRGNFNLHVLLHRDLATQSFTFASLPVADVGLFRRKDITATVNNFDFALGTCATTTASTRDEDTLARECSKELSAGRNFDLLLLVDGDGDVTAGDKRPLGKQNHDHQRDDHDDEKENTVNHFQHGIARLLLGSRGTKTVKPRRRP